MLQFDIVHYNNNNKTNYLIFF